MANIAVIVLNTKEIDAQPKLCPRRLQIEDNIGEAIHIHWRNLRLDFSIRDFIKMAEVCEQARNNLISITPEQAFAPENVQKPQTEVTGTNQPVQQNQVNLNPAFIIAMGQMTQYVTGARVLQVSLDDLLCIEILSKNPYRWEPKPIIESKPYNCLQGDIQPYNKYIGQFGEPEHGLQNLNQLKNSIEQHGYPHNNDMIVIFGNQPFIRDGQHRAAILRYLHGNIKVPVVQLLFKDDYTGWRMNPAAQQIRANESSVENKVGKPNKVLIVRPDAIGDFVLFSGVLKHYRDLFKDAEITVLTQGHITELARSCPYVDKVIGFNRNKAGTDRKYLDDLLRQLKDAEFDVAINTIYSRDTVSDSLTLGCGAKVTIASKGDTSNMSEQLKQEHDKLYTTIVPVDERPMPENERNAEFISNLAQRNIDRKCMPEIWIQNEDKRKIEELLHDLNVENPIVVCPFGKYPIRNWPDYKWAQLISKYHDNPVLVCGAAQDHGQGEKIIKQADHPAVYNLCGRITLRQLGALFKRARLCVGAESAAGHIAAAVDCPHVIIIGGGHFGRFMPYSPKTTLVHLPMDCYHCNWHCKYGQTHCISQIRIETVDMAIRQTLDGSGKVNTEPTLIKETVNSSFVPSDPVKVNMDSLADINVTEIDRDKKYIVTAIVSTYNAERYMAGCLEDLENQTIANRLEIIVVDSGSKQNEKAIIERFQQSYDNIRYIRTEERETIYKAWNRAIKIASGKYITNANTDDRHRPDALEVLVKAMEMYPDRVLAYPNQKKVSEENGRRTVVGELIKGVFTRSRLFGGECPPGSQPVWRRDVHDEFGYFDENFFIGGDLEFWFRLTQKYDFIYVDEMLGERLFRPEAVSIAENKLIFHENIIINKCYNYALQTSKIIDHKGISENPLFSDWPETRLWKKKVRAKITGTEGSETVYIANQWDLRRDVKPKLSVVIATHNRQQQLIENLNALLNQSDSDFEVIVVNNGGSLPDLRAVTDRFNCGICCVELRENFGPSYARNIGVSMARADYVALLDDDALPDKNFVANIHANFTKHNICGLRGKVLPKNPDNSNIAPACYDLGDDVLITTCEVSSHSAFKKDIFHKVGGYDTNLFGYENQELSYRIYKSQNEKIDCILYTPDVIVYHDSRTGSEGRIEKNLREKEMLKLARKKWPEIELYLQYIRSYYPQNAKVIEKDYDQLISNCLFLQENSPQEAVRWALKAVSLEPDLLKGRYLLGSLYAKLGKYAEAEVMLEPVFASVMQVDEFDKSESNSDSQTIKTDCYLSTGTKLAQCYLNQGNYDKVKQIYHSLLHDKRLNMPQQQIAGIKAVLDKLNKAPSLPTAPQTSNTIPESGQSEGRFLVSAIVSTYNSEKFLRGCLDDLVQQTIADKIEIIVVNSGSEQNEEQIVGEYQTKYDNIIYIKTDHREGIYSAWNRAVKVARGIYLTNANTDDRHRKDALEIMARTLQENPDVALVYSDQICTDTPNGTFENHHCTQIAKRPEYNRQRLLLGCCVGSQPMWKKSLHNEFGYFDEGLSCAGDWDFWLRISEKYKLIHIPESLGLYYYNEDGIEHGDKIHSLYERYIVGKGYGTPYISVIPMYNSNTNPLVSIITPAYNAAKYIAGAIESALIQNYRNFELLIINDGSTDETEEIVSRYKDDKIRYFSRDNHGVAATRNFGIKQSRGEFVVMLDSDDMINPEFIVSHLKEFEKHPEADFVYCDEYLIDENNKPIRVIKRQEYTDRKLLIRDLFRCGYPVMSFRMCIRKNVFNKIGFYDESLIIAEDYDILRRFVGHDLKTCHLKNALYLRRIAPGSLSRDFSTEKAESHYKVVERFVDTFRHDELFPDVAWEKVDPQTRQLHIRCLVAATYLSIGQGFIKTNSSPVYVKMAFENAWSHLNECLQIDPDNRQIRNLMQKCELGRQKYNQKQMQTVVC